MSRIELAEWLAMILVIVLWWPVVFAAWGPPWYRIPLTVGSLVILGLIFRRRLALLNQGFSESERMMQMRFEAEKRARGGDPDLSEKRPPDVSDQLSFLRPSSAPEDADPGVR